MYDAAANVLMAIVLKKTHYSWRIPLPSIHLTIVLIRVQLQIVARYFIIFIDNSYVDRN